MFEFGAWFCNVDQRASSPNSAVDNGCDRLRIQDNGDAGRQTLFDTGADSLGEGLFTFFMPGITWSVGPYRLRAVGGFAQDHDGNFKPGPSPNLAGKKRGRDFLIGHDLFLWSPKGWLTGSVNTARFGLCGYQLSADRRLLRCSKMSDYRVWHRYAGAVSPRDLHHQRVGSVVLPCAAYEHRWRYPVVQCFEPDHYRTEKPWG